jgi:hypothetical protein
MFKQYLFNLISRLIFSHAACGYEEYHGQCEDAYAAHIGLLHLELNRCFVLDHRDATISLHIPAYWGKLHLGYVICLGDDQIRQPGFYIRWHKPLPKVVYGRSQADPDNPIPF